MVNWYEDYAAAIAGGDPTYRHCESCGTATLPPRQRCPNCGEATLADRDLSPSATVVAATRIHVSTPEFADSTPYTVVLASFEEGVTLTGQFRGAGAVDRGDAVEFGTEAVGENHRILTFSPA